MVKNTRKPKIIPPRGLNFVSCKSLVAVGLPVSVELQEPLLFVVMDLSIGFILFDDYPIVINIGFKNTFALLGVVFLSRQQR